MKISVIRIKVEKLMYVMQKTFLEISKIYQVYYFWYRATAQYVGNRLHRTSTSYVEFK